MCTGFFAIFIALCSSLYEMNQSNHYGFEYIHTILPVLKAPSENKSLPLTKILLRREIKALVKTYHSSEIRGLCST